MGLTDTIHALGVFNSIAGAGVNYQNNVAKGADKTDALFGAMTLGSTNLLRNEWAYDATRHGNFAAGVFNAVNDYTTPEGAKNALFGIALSEMPPLWGGWGHHHHGTSIWGGGCGCNTFLPFGGMPMGGANITINYSSRTRGFFC